MAQTPADERVLTVTIDQKNMQHLSKNEYQLQIAKSVIAKGKLTFNTVWRSKTLSPSVVIKWKPIYAFNWTSDVFAENMSIAAGGNWMPCGLGDVVNIGTTGFFKFIKNTGDPKSMTIGLNEYKSENGDGIRIIIGIQNAAGTYDPIFVDPSTIPTNGSASFQPQEQLQWWYESGSRQGTVFTSHTTKVETGDFSKPDEETLSYKKKSSFDYPSGNWKTDAV